MSLKQGVNTIDLNDLSSVLLKDAVYGDVVRELMNSSEDTKSQIQAVKKVFEVLRATEASDGGEAVLRRLLCPLYMKAPHKHPVKKLLASGFLSLTDKYSSTIVQTLKELLLHDTGRSCDVQYKLTVSNCSALMDNFKLGQEVIVQSSSHVLKHLTVNLAALQTKARGCENPVAKGELLQLSLVTLQVFNKVLQKVTEKKGSDGAESVVRDSEGKTLIEMAEVTLRLLQEDSVLLDLRCNAAMTLTLICRVLTGGRVITMLSQSVFDLESSEAAVADFLLSPRDVCSLSRLSHLCLIHGILAMLPSDLLLVHCGKVGVFITDVVGAHLQRIIGGVSEGVWKLQLSRTLILFLSKCRVCLQETQHPSQRALCQSLQDRQPLPQSLLSYVSDHWEDNVDAVRHQANTVFSEVLACHLKASREDPASSPFLSDLMQTVLTSGLQCKGVYPALGALVKCMGGTDRLLQLRPNLVMEILALVAEQTLATYIGDLYITMATKDQLGDKLASDKDSGKEKQGLHCKKGLLGEEEVELREWQVRWIDPVLKTLCDGTELQRKYVLEYIVPKLIKSSPNSVVYIGVKLSPDAERGGNSLGALLMCLRQANAVGVLQQKGEDGDRWKGVLPWNILATALGHSSEQVRLEAFGLLCERPKSTEPVRTCEMELILQFLPHSLRSQTPAFRQQFTAYCKKLFIRLRDSGRTAANRTGTSQKNVGVSRDTSDGRVLGYKEFLSSLCSLLFTYIRPDGGFPGRTTSLVLLRHLVSVYGEEETQFDYREELSDHRIQSLLECLTDTFEENKKEAYAVLGALALDQTRIGELASVRHLVGVGLELAGSTRPQDCTTAAYLLNVGTRLGHSYQVWGEWSGAETANSLSVNSRETRSLLTVQKLLLDLSAQVQTAKTSLIEAAATKPMYPALHCVRYLLSEVNLREVHEITQWRGTVADILTICFQVAELVSPVVSSESPEGNVCFDENILGPGLSLETPLLAASEASVTKVNLMPEYLIVCCWRSIKEVSLLLGQLMQTVPLGATDARHDKLDAVDTLLSTDQVFAVGEYFTKQLLDSVHRGAFELAYAGFTKMTETLWRCDLPALNSLPRHWLESLVTDVLSSEPSTRLCATRRSAGLPFYIQAIVSMETSGGGGRECLAWIMEKLLPVATSPCDGKQEEGTDSTQVHALNILRALFRDTRLGEDVSPFVAAGMKAAILGYKSSVWAIRNSASLLFSALMIRIFGVKRTRDEASRKNLMTGRVFFTRFPSLYPFLLEEIHQATRNMGNAGQLHLHPGLYSVLMLLGKLYPATMETSTFSMNLSAFIPYINSCGHSPVYKTRVMAARAVKPLVARADIIGVIVTLLEDVVKDGTTMNGCHGALLQVLSLLSSSTELSLDVKAGIGTQVFPLVVQVCHLLQNRSNPCLLVHQILCDIVFRLLPIHPSNSEHHVTSLHEFLDSVLHRILPCDDSSLHIGGAEFYRSFTSQYLDYVCQRNDTGPVMLRLESLVHDLLQSMSYEVRLATLHFLCDSVNQGDSSEDFEHVSGVKQQCCREICESSNVGAILVELVMGREVYPECLALCLECLSGVKDVGRSAGCKVTCMELFSRLECLAEHPLDEVWCASLGLMGHLLAGSFTDDDKMELLSSLLGFLSDRCHSQHSVETRLACVDVLVGNVDMLLKDKWNKLGSQVFSVWSVLLTLLQDDDPEVRAKSATVLHSLNSSSTGESGGVGRALTESSVALDLTLHLLVASFKMKEPVGLLSTLFSWMEEDLEEEGITEDKELRLFDKGEMNTYSDDVTWISLVEKHTRRLVRSLIPASKTSALNPPHSETEQTGLCRHDNRLAPRLPILDEDDAEIPFCFSESERSDFQPMWPQVREFLNNKRSSLLQRLRARLDWVNPLSPRKAFLSQNEYRTDWVYLFRIVSALCGVLSTGECAERNGLEAAQRLLGEKCQGEGFRVNEHLNVKLQHFDTAVGNLHKP